MKTDEELGPDRGFVFETDDEDGEAERVGGEDDDFDCDDDDDDDDNDNMNEATTSSAAALLDAPYGVSWPKTCRQSMDTYGSLSQSNIPAILAGSSFTRLSSSFWSSPLQAGLSNGGLHSPLLPTFTSTEAEEKLLPQHLDIQESFSTGSRSKLNSPGDLGDTRGCTYFQSVFNGINVLCGVGLLTTPYAIKEGGWLGLVLLFGFSVIACYTGILFKRCLESNPELYTLPDIAQAAFGMPGRLITSIFLYVELYGAALEFIILMGDNLASLYQNAHLYLLGIQLNSTNLFAVVVGLIVLPTTYFRNLTILSYLSAGGVVASVLVAGCLVWVGAVDGIGFRPQGTALDIANLPVAIGLYGFCYAGHAVFPNIYHSMEKPSDYPSVLIVSFIVCSVLYAGVAVAGFLMFGSAVKSQFTLNMPNQFVASKIAVWTTVVNPLTKYAITLTPIALSVEELLPRRLRSHCISILIRTLLVLSSVVTAVTFPYFGFVMSLLGSGLTMFIALIFPCASYLTIMKGRLHWNQIAACSFIIIVGIVCSILGTYSSIKKIADKMG
ncbi:hypothetical protein H6P81_007535 [Aristolochia fimbriata]|uniref:Amino acid transporter transmembrane domain-containing protein n=1 Tax=Aristolochia fimbriata TaxID=158543 RepID=A0AAV7F3D1_ARIFI|nr:hypothetical protein H6P81_007535 [Aristolochia fimbriata]